MSHMIVPGDDDSWKYFAESVTCAGGTTSTDAIVIQMDGDVLRYWISSEVLFLCIFLRDDFQNVVDRIANRSYNL